MTAFVLSQASERALAGVDARLVAVVRAVAATGIRFNVSEGRRTLARQRLLFKQKKTKTLRSKHLTGHAVDCYPLGVKPAGRHWQRRDFVALVAAAKAAAQRLGVPMEFGHDWGWDSPHWEIKS